MSNFASAAPSRCVFWMAALLTVIAHGHLAFSQLPPKLVKGSEGNILARALGEHPEIVRLLGQQIVPLLLPYIGLFWLIGWLAYPRREARHWVESPAWIMGITWIMAMWALLRLHAFSYPNSLWAWMMLSVTSRASVYIGDALCIGWLTWRVFETARGQIQAGSWRRTSGMLVFAALIIAAVHLAYTHGVPGRSSLLAPNPAGNVNDRLPNVIVIGIDALRRDVALSVPTERMPHLANLRDRSFVQANMVTPLARTYGAWTSILTGMHPTVNGARENHAPRAGVRTDASIAWALKRAGYRTVYATDETRFSNIDSDYGFDEVVGPPPGVVDFLLGQFADMPLVNFSIQWPFMEYLTPALTGNRAFAQAYQPARFVSRLRHALGPAQGQPTLIAMHLCLPHHPFFSAAPSNSEGGLDGAYFHSAYEVDAQLGQLEDMLRQEGYLTKNTLLVLLADHGEGLSLDLQNAARLVQHGTSMTTAPPVRGHGGSLLMKSQWEVFAMFSGQSVGGPIEAGRSDQLASLEDLAPAILSLAGIQAPPAEYPLDVTLARGGVVNELPPRPYVLMETGFRPRGFNIDKPDAGQAVDIANTTYDIKANGRLELKAEAYSRALIEKDIGITDGKRLLNILWGDEEQLLVAVDYAENRWDVYPVEKPDDSVPPPILISKACEVDEIRSRIVSWCESAAQ